VIRPNSNVERPSGDSFRYRLSRRDGELLRVLASLMVVVVHCVHFWVESFYAQRNLLSLGSLATFIDQFVRFTVPLFFFLSGFGLTCQFMERPPALKSYYRFRPVKILAPFLLWSAFTSLRHLDYLSEGLPWRSAPASAALHLLKFLFVDGFDYQYYFVIVIFQFYLIFPFVYRLARNKWVLLGILLLQMAFMSPVEGYLELFGWSFPALHSSLLLFYCFYCFAGIYVAWHRDFFERILLNMSKAQVLFFWTGALCLLLAEYGFNIRGGKDLFNSDHFNRWSVILYCIASMLLFMKAKHRIQGFLERRRHWNFLFTGVAPYTFFVYLSHTHVLRLVDYLSWEVSAWDFVSRIFWVIGGSYALAWLSQWLLEDYPRLRFALGLPKGQLRWADLPGYSFLTARLRLENARQEELASLDTAASVAES
jgi:surface polysaccharide O-acyltransferase-like enzyme